MDLETVAMIIIAYSGDDRGRAFQALYSCQLTNLWRNLSITNCLSKLVSIDVWMGDKTGDKAANGFLNKTKLRILEEIRNNGNITKPQLMSVLELGKTTIDNGISTLR